MAEHFPMMVPGAAGRGAKQGVRTPYDGALLGTVAGADAKAVETALATAYALYRDRSKWLPPAKRIEILRKLAAIMAPQTEALALAAAREGGKPLIDSRGEILRAIDGVTSCAEILRTEAGHVIPMSINPPSAGRIAFTEHEPIGGVVAVRAFNHPVNLIIHQVVPAIATGCPFIVKPSADTPLSCFPVVKLMHEAGLP